MGKKRGGIPLEQARDLFFQYVPPNFDVKNEEISLELGESFQWK